MVDFDKRDTINERKTTQRGDYLYRVTVEQKDARVDGAEWEGIYAHEGEATIVCVAKDEADGVNNIQLVLASPHDAMSLAERLVAMALKSMGRD